MASVQRFQLRNIKVTEGTGRGMNSEECRSRFVAARVAILATVGPSRPHLVPIVFAVDGDSLFSAVDHKPKRTRNLQRLTNVATNPAVSLLVEEYDEDWDQLWWVRADGVARVMDNGPSMQSAIDLLVDRYAQYRAIRPEGPVMAVSIQKWSGWKAKPPCP